MIPIISIVGKSDSGKTTLLEKFLPELVRRGYRIATVKHDVHGFEVDREGKDSWRHKQSGAHTVVISSPHKVAVIRDVEKDMTLDEIRERFIQDVDLLLSEGYKREVHPKIEIFRKEKHTELLCTKEDKLIAIVSNQAFDRGVPVFDLDDMKGLADFVEKKYLQPKEKKTVSLFVDGKAIPLNPFVRGFIAKSIRGMVNSLKGCNMAGSIQVRIDPEDK